MPDPAEALLLLLMSPGDSPDLPSLDDLVHRPAWQRRAACHGQDVERYFPTARGVDLRPLRALCDGCPVRAECLDYAMADASVDGYWAGTTQRERSRMRKATLSAA